MPGCFACVNNSLVLPMFVNLPALNYKCTKRLLVRIRSSSLVAMYFRFTSIYKYNYIKHKHIYKHQLLKVHS